jgi:hypothetical protein
VTCGANATCSVNCGTDTTVAATTCPDGTLVCGRDCP